MSHTDAAGSIGETTQSESNQAPSPTNLSLTKVFYGKAGAWTAFFTFVLVVFSGLLWKVNDKANETSVASQRAFVNFGGPVIVKDIQNGRWKGVNVYYGWTNSGTTPAKDEVSEWNMSLGDVSPDKGTDFDSLPQNQRLSLVLGPKSGFQLPPVYLTTQQLESIADNKQHLFFWGWTTYRDIFPGTPKRLSEFCTDITSAVWTAPDHTSPAADWKTVSPPCPVHNCYDEDCEDYTARTSK